MADQLSESSKDVHICCGDIVPGCGFTASAASEEALLEQVARHAAQEHGVAEVTPELAAKVRGAIKGR